MKRAVTSTADQVIAPIAKDKLDEIAKAWGRTGQATWFSAFYSLVLVIICPICLYLNQITLQHFGGSYKASIDAFRQDGALRYAQQFRPRYDSTATLGYASWVVFQGLLYSLLPGPMSTGQLTPAGNLLKYRTNGLNAWILTHILFLGAGAAGLIDLAIIAKNWEHILVASVIYGFLLPAFAQFKANYFPTHPSDRKFSGSFIFDYFAGIELNPRFGELWDFKLFHNGRPGIVAWTLISISHTAYQYQKIGYVTNSMCLVNLFHIIYVLDFFVNEDWYLRTIDMAHDHFGYYLGFGSVAVVPSMYTIQAQYLAQRPVNLSSGQVIWVLAVGLGGYAIFRDANHQKDKVRATHGRCMIWGKPAEFIRAPYQTDDGRSHESLLLTSGTVTPSSFPYIPSPSTSASPFQKPPPYPIPPFPKPRKALQYLIQKHSPTPSIHLPIL